MNNIESKQNYPNDSMVKLLYKIIYFLMFCYILFYPHSITPLNVFLGNVTIFFNILAIVYITFLHFINSRIMLSWVLMFILLFSGFLSTEKNEISQLIQNVTTFLCLTSFIEGQVFIKIDKSLIKFLSVFNTILCFIFFIYSFMPFAYRYWLDEGKFETEMDVLTLGYSNPNALAMMFLFVATVNLISVRLKVYNKFWGIIVQILLIYLTYKTTSRIVLLCLIVLTILNFVTIRKIHTFFLYAFMAIPIIYIFLLPYLKSIEFLADLEILGKSIYTGREEIFVENMGYFKDILSLSFGNLSKGMFSNYHNGALSILLTCGILGLLMYLKIWGKNIIPFMNNTNNVSYIAIISLMIVLLHSSSEGAFLIGTLPYNIMLTTLFIFVRFKEEYIYENSSD